MWTSVLPLLLELQGSNSIFQSYFVNRYKVSKIVYCNKSHMIYCILRLTRYRSFVSRLCPTNNNLPHLFCLHYLKLVLYYYTCLLVGLRSHYRSKVDLPMDYYSRIGNLCSNEGKRCYRLILESQMKTLNLISRDLPQYPVKSFLLDLGLQYNGPEIWVWCST